MNNDVIEIKLNALRSEIDKLVRANRRLIKQVDEDHRFRLFVGTAFFVAGTIVGAVLVLASV